MRICFRDLKRAKKAAKSLAALVDQLKLSQAQEVVAKLCGYRDWHDLKESHSLAAEGSSTTEQRDQSNIEISCLALGLCKELDIQFGDALYALARMHLPGIQIDDPQTYETLWLELFKQTQPLQDEKRSPGKVIRIDSQSPGWTGRHAILKKSDGKHNDTRYVITHRSEYSLIADFEAVFPKNPLPLFVPARLKLAYGCWTEASGSKVLFSRDYKPLWRLTVGKKPERLQPWLWIDHVDSEHFWGDANHPWDSRRRRDQEERRLQDLEIVALPKLVDVLPYLVFHENIHDVGDAVDTMALQEDPGSIQTTFGRKRLPGA